MELDDLTPGTLEYLGRAAYLQLVLFENLARVVTAAPTPTAKESLGWVASAALAQHHGLVALIEREGGEPGAAMEASVAGIDEFQRRTAGEDWPQNLMTCYLSAGFLDEFLVKLAAGLPRDLPERVREVMAADSELERLALLLEAQIADHPRQASRLAMWGRRLVGDIMLVARGSLVSSIDRGRDEEKIEPVFTELIAAHTRRMDRLGLTA